MRSFKILLILIALTAAHQQSQINSNRAKFVVEPQSSITLYLTNPLVSDFKYVSISLIAKKETTLVLEASELSEGSSIQDLFIYKELSLDQLEKENFEIEISNPSDSQQSFFGFASFHNIPCPTRNTKFEFTFEKSRYGTIANWGLFYLEELLNENVEFNFIYSANIDTVEPIPDLYEILAADENSLNFQGFPMQGDDYLDTRFYLNYYILAEDTLTGQLWKFDDLKPMISCQLIEATTVLELAFNQSVDETYCYKHEAAGESLLTTWTDSDKVTLDFDISFEIDGVLSLVATKYSLSNVRSNTKTFNLIVPSSKISAYSIINFRATSTQLESYNYYYLSMITSQNQIIELKSGEEVKLYASSLTKSIILRPSDSLKDFVTFQAYSDSSIIDSLELFSEKVGEKPISLAKGKTATGGAKIIKYKVDLTNGAKYYAVLKISESLKENSNTLIKATLSLGEVIDNLAIAWYDPDTPVRMQYNILPNEDDIALILNESFDFSTVKAYASEKSENNKAIDLSGPKLSFVNGAVRYSRADLPNAKTILIEGSLSKSNSDLTMQLVPIAPVDYNDVERIQKIFSTKSDPAIFKLDLSKDSMANFFIYSPDTSKTITFCVCFDNPIVKITDANQSDIKIRLAGGSASKIDIPVEVRLSRNPVYITVFIEEGISAYIELIKSFKDYSLTNSLDTPISLILCKGQSKYIRFRIPDGASKLYFFPIFDKGSASIYYVLDSTSEVDPENHSFKPNFVGSSKLDQPFKSVEIKNSFVKFLNFKIIALEDTTGRFIISDGSTSTPVSNKSPKAVFVSSNTTLNYTSNLQIATKNMYLIIQTLSSDIKFAFDKVTVDVSSNSIQYIDREIDSSKPIQLEIEAGKSTIVLLEFFERNNSINDFTQFKLGPGNSKYELNSSSSLFVFSIPAETKYKAHDIALKLENGIAFKKISHILIKSDRYTTNEDDIMLKKILFYKLTDKRVIDKRMSKYSVSIPSKDENFFLIVYFEIEISNQVQCLIYNKSSSPQFDQVLGKTPFKFNFDNNLRSLILISNAIQLEQDSNGLVSIYSKNFNSKRCVAEIDSWYYSLKNSANHIFIKSLPDFNVISIYCPNKDDYIYASSIIPVDNKYSKSNVSIENAQTLVSFDLKPNNSTVEIKIKPVSLYLNETAVNNTVSYFNLLEYSNTKEETVSEYDFFEHPEKFKELIGTELTVIKEIDSNSYYTALIAKDKDSGLVQLYQTTHFNFKNNTSTDKTENDSKALFNSNLIYVIAGFGAIILIVLVVVFIYCCVCKKRKAEILVEHENA